MKTTLKQNFVAGLLAMTIMAGASPSAHAQTPSVADLQVQIAELLSRIASLQAQVGQGVSAPASCATYTWTRSLSQGSTGFDIQRLQQFLNQDPDTRVALQGAGSLGAETMFYGPATAAAVSKFQVKYRSEILTPSGLVNPTGFFGPSSRNKANALCATVTPVMPAPPVTPVDEDGDIESDPEETVTLRGEGTLAAVTLDSAETTDVNEASGDAPIAELTLEAQNGDIRINRLDIALVAEPGNTERDPWDTFENISLWVDGEKITEVNTESRNRFLNRNLGTLRFSNLDLVIREDKELEIIIAASVRNNIRGAGSNASWNVSIERLRYFDADNVATDESSFGDLGESVSFNIVERGEGEELKFSLRATNADDRNIIVNDTRRTNNVTILEYTIEAIDNDIELDSLFVNIETGFATYNDVVRDVRLIINGKTFRHDAILTTGNYSTTSARVAFDIDGDIEIDEDQKVIVRVVADLHPQRNYPNGETLIGRITSAERDITRAEGADDVRKFSGTVIGRELRLVAEGIITSPESVIVTTATQGQNNTTGIFTITFDVTAVEGDFFIAGQATSSATTTIQGVRFTLDAVENPTTVTSVLTATADEDDNGVFMVREGETETFTLQVIVDAAAAGQYRVGIEEIVFSRNNDGVTEAQTYQVIPLSKYRTSYQFINQ